MPAFAPPFSTDIVHTWTATQTFTPAANTSALVITAGASTASAPVLTATQTWNNAGVTFVGEFCNFTNTASAAASLLVDWQLSTVSKFAVGITTSLLVGVQAANTTSLANLTNAQVLRVYNTTDAGVANYERGKFAWESNVLIIGADAPGGTGTTRAVTFTGNTSSLGSAAGKIDIGTNGNNGAGITLTTGIGGGSGNSDNGILLRASDNSTQASHPVGGITLTTGVNTNAGSSNAAGSLALNVGATTSSTTAASPSANGTFAVAGVRAKDTSNTAGTGAAGGLFSITGTQGGNATAATGSSTGGAGSALTLTSGAGGSATGGGGTRTGGAAGTLTLATGAIGTGADANGAVGPIIFQQNAAEVGRFTIAGLFALAGATSSFPAFKRSTTTVQARLADDSAFTNVQGKITTDANATTGLVAGAFAALTTATIVLYDATGTAYAVPCSAV